MTAVQLPKITLWDFVDPSKPWVLGSGKGLFDDFFKFVPDHYRHGPWHVGPMIVLGIILYSLAMAAVWMWQNPPPNAESWMSLYHIDDSHYMAFTMDWYANLAVFLWMAGMCYSVIFHSPMGGKAWIAFTLWSWTSITVRAGLTTVAPFVEAVRVPAEVLRFPALMSATITFVIWNFVLFPAIYFFYIKCEEQKKRFFDYFTNFRLTQLHVFNIAYAIINCAWMEPRRPLHLGDLAAGFTMFTMYMVWYLCVLDRLGIHLYPIFSPRSRVSIPSMLLATSFWVGGYAFWKKMLPNEVES